MNNAGLLDGFGQCRTAADTPESEADQDIARSRILLQQISDDRRTADGISGIAEDLLDICLDISGDG